MNKSFKFPILALPFAVVGGTAGWLSAAFLANPILGFFFPQKLKLPAAGVASAFAAIAGVILTRCCDAQRRRNPYSIGDEAPVVRSFADHWAFHAAVVMTAGILTGATLATLGFLERFALFDVTTGPRDNEFLLALTGGATLCALAFVPVCLAVLRAARLSQRARLGSIVASSDRRAIWGILAALLPPMTLGAAIDWPAARLGHGPLPLGALGILMVNSLLLVALLVADLGALRIVRQALSSGLTPQDEDSRVALDEAIPALDLGLGDGRLARLEPSASTYRGKERAIGIVEGDPGLAETALRRSVRRGVGGVALALTVCGIHAAANSGRAAVAYNTSWCESGGLDACRDIAKLEESGDPLRALELYEHGCHDFIAIDCLSAARLHEQGRGLPVNLEKANELYAQACATGHGASCVRSADLLIALGKDRVAKSTGNELLARGCWLGDPKSCDRKKALNAAH